MIGFGLAYLVRTISCLKKKRILQLFSHHPFITSKTIPYCLQALVLS